MEEAVTLISITGLQQPSHPHGDKNACTACLNLGQWKSIPKLQLSLLQEWQTSPPPPGQACAPVLSLLLDTRVIHNTCVPTHFHFRWFPRKFNLSYLVLQVVLGRELQYEILKDNKEDPSPGWKLYYRSILEWPSICYLWHQWTRKHW